MSPIASHDDHHDPERDDGRHAGHGEAGCGGLGRWLTGADAVQTYPRPVDDHRWAAAAPIGRLHAIGDAGLIYGRALCLAPVVPLDPVAWSWPDSADCTRPLCWICLALTHTADDGPHPLG